MPAHMPGWLLYRLSGLSIICHPSHVGGVEAAYGFFPAISGGSFSDRYCAMRRTRLLSAFTSTS